MCFPQFASLGPLPKHGLLRTRQWTLAEQRCGDDYALVVLRCADDAATRAVWPHAFAAELTVGIDNSRCDIELEIENTGGNPFEFTGALHSYLRVHEVEESRIEGLHGFEYRDAVDADRADRDAFRRARFIPRLFGVAFDPGRGLTVEDAAQLAHRAAIVRITLD